MLSLRHLHHAQQLVKHQLQIDIYYFLEQGEEKENVVFDLLRVCFLYLHGTEFSCALLYKTAFSHFVAGRK